jgi:hypothetical protein
VVDTAISLIAPEAEARIERVTASNDPFPDGLTEGAITFFAAAEVGETVTGDFSSTFNNGKTLNGTFDATLTSCSFEDETCL